jgi:hypothetical protein
MMAGRGDVRLGEACYILAVVTVTAVAMSDPNHPRQPLVIAAALMCLPASVGALPVLYVAAALAWGLANTDRGGVTWPVTAAYAAVAGLAAVANIMLLHGRLDRRRASLAEYE